MQCEHVDAKELAKFFEWMQEHGGWHPCSKTSRVMCDEFKAGKVIAIFDKKYPFGLEVL